MKKAGLIDFEVQQVCLWGYRSRMTSADQGRQRRRSCVELHQCWQPTLVSKTFPGVKAKSALSCCGLIDGNWESLSLFLPCPELCASPCLRCRGADLGPIPSCCHFFFLFFFFCTREGHSRRPLDSTESKRPSNAT